ncbi:MAG: protealysin inhibitor emfourin [Roseiflexaceae bacterium]
MRVELQTEGGLAFFPGLNKPIVLNSTDLPKAQVAHLQRLLDSTRFFELPAASRSIPKGAADLRRYTITVEDGRRRRTVRLTDPVEDTNLQALLEFLQKQRDVA